MARPKKNKNLAKAMKGNKNAEIFIDWNKIDELLKIGCTQEEIATVLDVDTDTLTNHCKREKNILFSDYIKKGNQNFKTSLRRLQFRSAEGIIIENGGVSKVIQQPSVTMQIWLGKQFLGQSDKQELTGKDGDNIGISFNKTYEKN